MNNRNNNKKSSIQKVDLKDKVSDDNSTTSKKDFSSKALLNIVFNKYRILAYSILIIVPFSFVIGSLCFGSMIQILNKTKYWIDFLTSWKQCQHL